MTFASDLRYSFRSFARTPGLTSTLVLSIALGVGSNAAMFAFVGGLVSGSVDGADPDAARRFRHAIGLLVGASGLVLFLACSTVAALLLARARVRAHEMAVRIALGASRRTLGVLCLADALVISTLGGSVGVVFGWWASLLFPLLFFVEDADQLAMTPDPLWLTAAASVWMVVLLGSAMAPVLTVPRLDPWSVLRRESAGVSGASTRLRNRVAMAQIAACCLLLLLAGMIRADLQTTLRTARGLGLGSLLVVPVEASTEYLFAAEAKVREVPGVSISAWARTLPGGRAAAAEFAIARPQARTLALSFDTSTFEPEQRTADDILPVSGRPFRGGDGPASPLVALINQVAADRYFNGDALGRIVAHADGSLIEIIGVLPPPAGKDERRPELFYYANQIQRPATHADEVFLGAPDLTRPAAKLEMNVVSSTYFGLFGDPPIAGDSFSGRGGSPRRIGVISRDGAERFFGANAVGGALIDAAGGRIEIVGVVGAAPLGAVQRAREPMLLVPLGQAVERRMTLAIRVREDSDSLRNAVTDAMGSVPGGRVLAPVSTFEEHLVRNSLAAERVSTLLLGVSAAIALVMSIAGIHGAMADLVARRRRELALRIALGARAMRLIGEVVRAGLRLALVGAAAGLGGALLVAPLLGQIILRPNLPSLAVLSSAGLAIGLLVGVSCAVPAWRAVTVDPREVMR